MSAVASVMNVATHVLFVWIAWVAVVRWRREQSRHAAVLAGAVVLLALWSTGSWLGRLLGVSGPWLDAPLTAAFAGAGYLVLIHRSLLVPLRAAWKAAAGIALLAGVVGTMVTRPVAGSPMDSPTFMVVAYGLLAVWLVTVGEPAVRIWRHASRGASVRQTRLRLLSLAYAAIAVMLLLLIGVPRQALERPGVAVAVHVAGLGLLAVLYLAVDPPQPLRAWWLRRNAARVAARTFPVATWYYDLADGQLWWSDRLRDLLGVDRDEPATFDRFRELLDADDVGRVDSAFTDVIETGVPPTGLDLRLRTPDGAGRWVYGDGELVSDVSGAPVAMFGIMQDITDRKESEQRLIEALEAERQITEQLRDIDRMKSTFLSAVSHELRTPLTSIQGFAAILSRQRGALDDAQIDLLLERLQHNAGRLGSLLEDLLDLDRLDRDALALRRRPVDLAQLVRRVIEQVDMEDHPVHVDGTDGQLVSVDPPRVERMLENLLVNAIRHTPSGTPVWVRSDVADGAAVITVADAGPGIPEHLRETIFEPFRHGEPSPVRGTGVGLSIVARFAELHGGRVDVTERRGGGAMFRILLPDPEDATVASAPASAPLTRPASTATSRE